MAARSGNFQVLCGNIGGGAATPHAFKPLFQCTCDCLPDGAITTATATAQVYWTTNGSPPNPTNGTLYTAPILVTNTTFLRAAAFAPGLIPTDVDTHTYIFLNHVLRQSATQPGYPTTWQASYPADYGMDPNVVNSAKYGPTLSNDLRSIPTLSVVSDHNGLSSHPSVLAFI